MHQIPGLFRFQILKIRRHWCSVQSGHENAIEVLVRMTTLKSLPSGEIVDRNRPVRTSRKRGSRRPISVSFLPVALRALHFLVYLPSTVDALLSVRRLRRYRHHRFWLFFTKTWRKGFYIGDEINSLLSGERQPGRHGASVQTPPEGFIEVSVGGNMARIRGAALENAGCEITRLRVQIRRIFARPVSPHSVAAHAIAPIQLFASLGNSHSVVNSCFGNCLGRSRRSNQADDCSGRG